MPRRDGLSYTDPRGLIKSQVHFVPNMRGDSSRVASGRLKLEGSSGHQYLQMSNRAELRAVIGVLDAQCWWGAGFNTFDIATDSEYVEKGATEWCKTWLGNGWVTSRGEPVENRDFWEHLLKIIDIFGKRALKIKFWKIPRTENVVAGAAAKNAAEGKDKPIFFISLIVGA